MESRALGSTWLLKHKGLLWPATIVGEDDVPKAFKDAYLSPGYFRPVLILGSHELLWCKLVDLVPFDPCHDYVAEARTAGDSENFGQAHWEEYEDALREATTFPTLEACRKMIASKEAIRKMEDDDSDVEITKITTAKTANSENKTLRKKRKRKELQPPGSNTTPTKSNEKDGVNSEDENATKQMQEQPHECRECGERFTYLGRLEMHQRIAHTNGKHECAECGQKYSRKDTLKDHQQKVHSQPGHNVDSNPDEHSVVAIRFGQVKESFVRRSAIEKYPPFTENIRDDENGGSYISTQELRGEPVGVDAFGAVVQFLNEGDFEPRLIERGQKDLLEGGTVNKEEDVPRWGEVYCVAASLGMEDLQTLVCKKLNAMIEMAPLDIQIFLQLVKIIFRNQHRETQVDRDLRLHLSHSVASRYYALMDGAASTMCRVMNDHEDLAQYVHSQLAKNPKMGREGYEDD